MYSLWLECVLLAAAPSSASDGGTPQRTWHDWLRTSNAADVAMANGDAAGAERLYREALAIGASLAQPPPFDAPNVNGLVRALAAQKRCTEELARSSDERVKAAIWLAQGQLAVAEQALRDLAATYERADPEHPDLAPVGDLLAYLSWADGRTEESDRWAERALSLRRKPLKSDNLDSAVAKVNGLKKASAKKWMAKVPPTIALAGAHPLWMPAMEHTAQMYERAGKTKEAVKFREQARALREKPLCDR